MNNTEYNKLLINIILFNFTIDQLDKSDKYFNIAKTQLDAISINKISNCNSYFPFLDDKKLINDFIKRIENSNG